MPLSVSSCLLVSGHLDKQFDFRHLPNELAAETATGSYQMKSTNSWLLIRQPIRVDVNKTLALVVTKHQQWYHCCQLFVDFIWYEPVAVSAANSLLSNVLIKQSRHLPGPFWNKH